MQNPMLAPLHPPHHSWGWRESQGSLRKCFSYQSALANIWKYHWYRLTLQRVSRRPAYRNSPECQTNLPRFTFPGKALKISPGAAIPGDIHS